MKVTVLGVPDSAGAYCVGVEDAPAALREAGLLDALAGAGHDVRDAGDLMMRRWKPDRAHPRAQNLPDEVDAARELADAASVLLEDGARLLVLGGSCLVALGVSAAVARHSGRPRLVYIDRHLDLNTPASTEQGSLSWMGMAHALDIEGSVVELAEAFGPRPLLAPEELVYLGVSEAQTTEWERRQREALGVSLVPQSDLVADPAAAARRALSHLPAGPFVTHVDVDVLDFLDAPLAEDSNGANSGPTLDQLGLALRELAQAPHCLGLSLGQLNPAHASADPTALPRLVGALTYAFRD
ncbi:arginase family protein [Gryllotalpicola koreensis]|uniref:Agmatinase n=1 Tax=Gryllotalpicola koreensis TaxID=993086 RepID=A0ABP8A5B4_9MICO